MVIAINTQALIKNRLEGLGWFTCEMVSRLTKNHPEHQFVLIFDRPWDPSFIFAENVIPVKTWVPSRHPVLWYYRFEYLIPQILKKYNASLLVSTDGYIPQRPAIKTYNVIHDIGFVHNPKIQPWLISKYYNHFFPIYARAANRLGTVSNYSKDDLVKTWNLDPDKIDVIYNGSNSVYQPVGFEEKKHTENQITNGCPYFVYVGSLNPRKNIEGLLRGFEIFKSQKNTNYKLVLLGEPMWNQPSIEKTLSSMSFRDEVIFLGRRSPSELQQIIGAARALVLVSHLEGFGIPLVEAMNCDVPVVCSNITSMPEVAGNAGILVDPFSDGSIADGLSQIAFDDALRQRLIENGRLQRQKFSWDKSAERFWDGILKCIED
jgi:glycosyltransferase involved in cell wall biosynthesis